MNSLPTFEPEGLRLSDYHYDLPEHRIAKHPLDNRDSARLLIYRQGNISHEVFRQIPSELPENTLLVGNDTRVIRARLHFFRKTGAHIEVFLLNPHDPPDVHQAMESERTCVWQCMIGNKKRWKESELLELNFSTEEGAIRVQASWHDKARNLVRLTWVGAAESFAVLIDRIGELPLPPYLNRKANEKDLHQYQTVYAAHEGAVAAPTAGLHFTPAVLADLTQKGIDIEYLTLHVGAGTFQPVKQEAVWEHEMHSEQMRVSRQNLQRIIQHTGPVIPIGTTSMRVLESLYWLGVQLKLAEKEPDLRRPMKLDQQFAYRQDERKLPDTKSALSVLLDTLVQQDLSHLTATTSIYIMPGYSFRICKGLITNFHLPETTLLLLIAAMVGDDWKRIYQAALDQGYRFLSYGDSSLLLPE